ncbi:GNAT family N-acetyltransferase [Tenggerimyces flavus]|uniref:GNAT family N-acetyltransferase n=1 Tax=Tenggerimyces flavus TaxID=1708749 RepID=A0ABV7YBG3_9ACTN|nr:GNAT family N-acetyltransferase [Tenggerimyces flavus]MBM7788956.1 ribosomal-protein-alanine N-acetyltransferase [Tenggerimyces flavus]
MPELQRLRADHAPALLEFERENRAYFAASIPDRGDAFFASFDQRHRDLLALQDAGTDHFHVLVEPDGSIVGRVNLVYVTEDGSADLGYRIAEHAAGRGLATAAVREVLELAPTYGLTSIRAETTLDNAASRVILGRVGFEPTGDVTLSGKPGISFLLKLA